jgi:hypothetical protein
MDELSVPEESCICDPLEDLGTRAQHFADNGESLSLQTLRHFHVDDGARFVANLISLNVDNAAGWIYKP